MKPTLEDAIKSARQEGFGVAKEIGDAQHRGSLRATECAVDAVAARLATVVENFTRALMQARDEVDECKVQIESDGYQFEAARERIKELEAEVAELRTEAAQRATDAGADED
jgi:Mg2+ and Co2+ transporter CorA